MRILKLLVYVFLWSGSISFLTVATPGQDKVRLPPDLSQSSSLSEILDQLGKNYFGPAVIGLSAGYESANFSRGFKLTSTDGCYVTLRNDDVKILNYATRAFPEEYQSLEFFRRKADKLMSYPAELYLRLSRMNPEKGKRSHLHNKDPERAKVLGSWQTEFKVKSGRSRPQDDLLLVIFDSVPGDGRDEMFAGSITFTFDDRETSEQFDAAFRQAIKLCTTK